MAYFSNGEEGRYYEAKYCDKCIHQDIENGCVIWGLHLLYVGEEQHKPLLDMLIPMKPNGHPDECSMFLVGEHPSKAHYRDQQKLEAWKKAVQP